MNRFLPMRNLLILATGLCLMLATIAPAQKRASSKGAKTPDSGATPNKLISIKVTGKTRYTDKEILGVTGLKLGQDAGDGEFKEATQRLGQSGLFSSVSYSFSYSDRGVKVEFQLADKDKITLLPTRFENFVWFSDAELHAILEQRVPLLKNSLLPDSGRLADYVRETLQALLTEHDLPGRVEFMRESKRDGSGLLAIVYRVEDVSIRIRNLEFPGASPEQSAFLERAAHQLMDADYSRSKVAAIAQFDLLPLYQQRGYLKVAFGPSDAHVVSGPGAKTDNTKGDESRTDDSNSSEVTVDAIVPITPGKVYSVSGVTWKGNSAVTTDEASKLFHLVIDRPADAVRVVTDAENLTRLYHNRGYMMAEVKPEAQIDEEKSTVHYEMNVTEGDLYRMGELEIVGVDTPSKDRLHAAWKLREGEPYNAEYTRNFLDEAAHLVPSGLRYTVKSNEVVSKKDKVVDVTIQFKVQ
jgi:outer membrane protein assembly factor BamA